MVTNNSANAQINANQTFVGQGAGNLTESGAGNVALGASALSALTIGTNNIGIGASAMGAATSAGSNVGIGPGALSTLTTGASNIGIGPNACGTTNSSNIIGIGNGALQSSTGIRNMGIGTNALGSLTTGTANMALGFSAGSSYTSSESNNVCIGALVTGTAGESAVIRIGTQGTQTKCVIAGIDGATSTGGVAVFINGSGILGTSTSSIRFKEDVENIGSMSERLLKCRPVTFFYKEDPEKRRQYGMIAEEVHKILPELVVEDCEGLPKAIRYEQMICMLVNEVKKLNQRVKNLEGK